MLGIIDLKHDSQCMTASKMVNTTKQFQAERFEKQKEKIPTLIQDTLWVEADIIAKKIINKTYEQNSSFSFLVVCDGGSNRLYLPLNFHIKGAQGRDGYLSFHWGRHIRGPIVTRTRTTSQFRRIYLYED